MSGFNPTRRYKPGMDLYLEPLPDIGHTDDPNFVTPLDCDSCKRKFTAGELAEFAKPFLNQGQQEGKLKCPACGYEMPVAFTADSIQ